MNILEILNSIREKISKETESSKNIIIYSRKEDAPSYFKEQKINVKLEEFKQIILQDETGLELGGANKKSFSLIFPLHVIDFINDGNITLIGSELSKISEDQIDFGLFMLIGFEKISEKDFDNLRQFNFISNGIEGFMIRTIPRRFWCRISTKVRNRFSLELLGNAIMYLYSQKFGNLIKSMEIFFITMPEMIDAFIELTSEIQDHLKKKWNEKINEWKKRLDCDYDWECNECPYSDTCEDVKEVLEEREKLY